MEKSSLVSRNPYRSLSLSWKPSSWISTTAVPAHTTKPAATTTKRRRKARYRFFANIGLAAYLIASGTLIVLIFTYVALWTYENFTMCDEGDGSLESLEVLEEGILVNNEASGTPRQYAATLGFLARLDPLAIRIYCAMGLSMAEAKAIDIVWNLFVGRLGQFVLAYVTYRVMAVWLVDAMTRYPVPYQMVRETALPSSSGFMVLLQFLRVRSSTPIWKHCKGQIIVFAFCILYVLIFPTLNSAMSGYRAAGTPYFQAPNGDLIEIPNLTNTTANPENVRRVRFSIANGSLIGQSDPTYAWGAVISGSNETGFAQPGTPLNITTFQGLDLLQEVYRLYNNCTQDCNAFHSPSGITYTIPSASSLGIQLVAAAATDLGPSMDEVGFIVQDRLYTMRQYIDSWVCVSRALYYWGFSYHLLAAWSFLNFFHTLALWLSWVRATRRTAAYLRDHPLNHHNRRRRRHYNNIGNGTVDTDSDSDDDDDLGGDIRSRYGVLRAVVDLAAVARDVIGIDIHGMSDRQIEKRLDAARAGIVVMHRDDRVTSWDWASEYRATATGFSSGGDVEDVLPRQTAFSPHQES